MALALTSGGESRLDGAPGQALPHYEDMVQAAAVYLVSQDQEGALYGGDPANARADAIRLVQQQEQARWQAEDAASQQRQREIAAAGAERNRMRAERQGVVPESLPMDEYGAVSGRTVQEANRPLEDAEAALAMEQEAADGIIRGMREGQRNWEAEGDYTYLQERGERFPNAAPGERDMDYRNRIRQRRGQTFYTSDGTAIPVGREPTPQEIEAERKWYEWANQTPGSERQALYDPQAYEAHREGVREGIRNRAREDMALYGTGTDDQLRARIQAGDQQAVEQYDRRMALNASEDRVSNSDWQQRRRQERLAARAGLSPEAAAAQIAQANTARNAGMSPEEVFEESLRVRGNLNRLADRQARRDLVAQRGELRGAGLSPAVGDMRNRFDDLIDRLGQEGMNDWQRAGMIAGIAPNAQTANPTPLGVDAMGMQNALRFVNNEAIAGMDPLRRQAAQAQLDMQMRQQVPDIAGQQDIAEGNFQTPEARAHLDGLAERHDTTTGGFSYDDEARLAATLQRPPYNMPQPEAEALAYELAEGRRHTGGVRPGQRGRDPASPAPGPSGAPPQAPPPAQPPVRRAPQGGGRGGGGAEPPAWTETRPVNPSRRGRRR